MNTHNVDTEERSFEECRAEGLKPWKPNMAQTMLLACGAYRFPAPTYRQLGLPGTPRNNRVPHSGHRECLRRNTQRFKAQLKEGLWA